jgi:hypothetical protein
LIFKFFDSKLEDNRFCTKWRQASLHINITEYIVVLWLKEFHVITQIFQFRCVHIQWKLYNIRSLTDCNVLYVQLYSELTREAVYVQT